MRLLLTSLLFLLASCGETTPKQQMRKYVGSAVVKITGQTPTGRSSGGTGFSVTAPSGKSYILTNKHICGLRDAENRLTIKFPKFKRTYSKRVLEISTKHDLCLVESIPQFKRSLTVASRLSTGQGIYVVGHPKLYALTVAEGEYIEEASINVRMSKSTGKPTTVINKTQGGFSMINIKTFKSARFHVYSRGGNSGSPIVNFNGDLVSVLFAGNRMDVMETYGVPHRFVKEFLEGY